MALMLFTRIAHTAKGSTIDALGCNCFRVCDPQGHCQTVQGLWNAEEVIRRSEKAAPQIVTAHCPSRSGVRLASGELVASCSLTRPLMPQK